jgi:hypothetical protein
MVKRKIGLHRKHKSEHEEKKKSRNDSWDVSFSKDKWSFGKNTAPDFSKVVPKFKNSKIGKFESA